MTKASDNAFPSILITEGTEPSAPAAGKQRLYIDSTSHALMVVNSSGTESAVAGAAGSVATDALWDAAGDLAVGTGANTAAKLTIGAAGGHVSRINGAVAWNSGTAFPTATTGDRFWRTDLGLEAYYDGTRWLTTQLFTTGFVQANAVSAYTVNNDISYFSPFHTTYDIWFVSWYATVFVATTNTGSAYWNINLNRYTAAAAQTTLATVNTSAIAANTFATLTVAVGALLTPGTYPAWTLSIAKTSTPGGLTCGAHASYRLVLT